MEFWISYFGELADCLIFCREKGFENLVQFLLVFEVFFLIVITLISLGIRLIREHIQTKKQQFTTQVRRKIERVLQDNRVLKVPRLNHKQRSVSVLLPLLEDYSEYHQSQYWNQLKSELIKTYLMPKVKRLSKSRNWKKRNQVLRIYQLDLRLFPEEWIISALDDPLTLNQIHAALCVGQLGTRASVNALLNQLMHSGRFGKLAFEDALLQGNPQSIRWVKERYLEEPDIDVRKICLDILAQKLETGIVSQIEKDLANPNFELRLAAARALGAQPSEASLGALGRSFKDENWVVRATTAKSLGRLGDQRAVPLLAHGLRDSNWWVRLNSAMALLDFDDLGTRVLRMQDPAVDNYAYEMARYVLALKA